MSIARFSRADMERIARDFVRGERALRADTVPKPGSLAGLSGLSVDVEILVSALIGRGQHFHEIQNQEFSGGDYNVGLSLSLQDASAYAVVNDGFVASMPLLVAGKSKADSGNYLWRFGYDCLSEELVGVDEHGVLAGKGEPLVVVVHGGGLLTESYRRIMQAYTDELVDGWGKISTSDFGSLLKGELPNGRRLSLYSVQDVIDCNILNPLNSTYAVWLPLAAAKSIDSGYLEESSFKNSQLVVARAGTLEYLDSYFSKAAGYHSKGTVGNYHVLAGLNAEALKLQPRGRVLFVSNDYDGLDGSNLDGDGRFVGVAPEAP